MPQVKAQRPTAARDDWNIDMQESSAEVAYFEESFAEKLSNGICANLLAWDDHSKLEAGKKRGWAARRCVQHQRRVATAPYSDMGVRFGGSKIVINSMLFTLPPGADPDMKTTSLSKRGGGTLVHKQAIAVTRLDGERRSTPVQQFNDLRLAIHSTSFLVTHYSKCDYQYSISDNGFDHSVRSEEVQLTHTRFHIDCKRLFDGATSRAKGGSSYQEAERVNAVETIALAKGSVPNVGEPTTLTELRANKRAFQMTVCETLKGACYGCAPLISLASYPGVPHSDHTSESERTAMRTLMALRPEKQKSQPHVETYSNIMRYKDLHTVARHYNFQIGRGWCEHALGRLCTAADYTYGESLWFEPCCSFVPASGDVNWCAPPIIPRAPLDTNDPNREGHRLRYTQACAAVAAGTLNAREVLPATSKQLKAWAADHGLTPSKSEVDSLAIKLLGALEKSDDIEKSASCTI